MNGVPLHPMLVHFPIALWLVGTVWLLVSGLRDRPDWSKSAWILLAIAALTSIPAALTGQNEWMRLDVENNQTLENHRDLGILLPWLMNILILFRLHFYLKREKTRNIPWWIWALCCIFVSVLLVAAGWTGGHLVYLFGFGHRG